MSAQKLFQSRSGELACGEHIPARESDRWQDEGWHEIGSAAEELRSARDQCQHCSQRSNSLAKRSSVPVSPLVLNVDDRPAQLYARDRVLRRHGFTVANVDTIKAALDTARQIKPQVILLDVHLPDGDGRELCRRMKADTELSHIPIVLISATLSGHVNQLETVRWGGADAFIQEPVAPETMVSTIWRVVTGAP